MSRYYTDRVAEQHPLLRATGPARTLGVLVLLAGIVAMHAVVFAMSGHAAAHSDHSAGAGGGGLTAEMAAAATGTDRMLALRTGTALEPMPHSHDLGPGAMPHSHGLNQAAGAGGSDLGPTAMPIDVAIGQLAMPGSSGAAGADCAGDGCGGLHGGMHGCVFILAAAAMALALVLLYRMADRPGNGVARLRHPRPRRERSPPWTVLSLAELSILRI